LDTNIINFFDLERESCFIRAVCQNAPQRVCVRGFSAGHERSELAQAKSEASKRATNFGLAKTSNFL